jgi:ankyrin repeat protein
MSYYPKLPISLRKKVFEQLQFSIQNETPIPGDIQEAHFWLSQVEKEFPILPPSASAFQLSFKTIGNPSRRREVATAMACLVSSPLKAHIRDFEDRLDAVQAGNTDIDDLFVPSKEGGYNCFHAAVYENLPYVISRLKNAGGDVNMTADGNWSPLHEAVLLGRVSCASELLKCGANINENSDKGGTPLTLSIIAPPSRNRDMFNLLLSFNANPCIPHNGMYRDTAAHFAASLWVEGLQILLNRDPDLAFAVDSVGATPLHLAALDGNVESIKMLVKLGSDVNAKDVDDHTPLHNCWAMFQVKQHIPSMPWENRDITPYRQARELLIASGADLESRNRYGAKPSTWALQSPFAQALSTFDRARMTRILGSDPRSWEGSQSNVPDAWQARRSLPSIQCC